MVGGGKLTVDIKGDFSALRHKKGLKKPTWKENVSDNTKNTPPKNRQFCGLVGVVFLHKCGIMMI
jgi:hypothetical protein